MNNRQTADHQWDTHVLEGQKEVNSNYRGAHVYQMPQLNVKDEAQRDLAAQYPTFRNPWHVDPSLSTSWNLEQPNLFAEYKPQPGQDANGGMFIGIYDALKPPVDYYSIRASHVLDGATKQHKATDLEVGDYAFLEWEAIYAALLPDPKVQAFPPLAAYVNSQEYDTKIVDFLDQSAIVNAQYKKHRSSDRVQPPTNVNSQRKVALDRREVYHAVYESGGRIWYVQSTDRGVSWSPEQRVSDNGAQAARPSIASIGESAWICFVQDGEVVVRIAGAKGWETLYSAPVTMKSDCTPAIAVLPDYEGAAGYGTAVCLVWEDQYELRFAVLQLTKVLVDNQLLAAGQGMPGSVTQPRYPSVAASTMMAGPRATDHGFHIAWIENGNIYYVNIGVDRRTNPFTLVNWSPGATPYIETVHARTGSVGAAYPARHAPSIAVTEQGTVHVAFDVQNWFSPWPVNSSSVGLPGNPTGTPISSLFALRERPLPTLHGPTWQTTATLVGGSSNSTLCSPTVGAKPAGVAGGSKSNSLRVIYNDSNGQLRVARFDGGLNIGFHAEGWDPSVTAWSARPDAMVDVYSYAAQQPYAWHLLASQNGLAKEENVDLLRMRQIILSRDEALVSFGLAMPRLTDGTEVRPVNWNEAHDSLVIGVNSTLAEKMRTAVFTPAPGERLLLDVERFGMKQSGTQAEILLRVHDAKNGTVLRVISIPLNAFASAAAMAVQEIDLSSVSGAPVYVSADVYSPGEEWNAAVVDRYAPADACDGMELEKERDDALALAPVLKQNHPNPFNPSTTITWHLPAAGELRLAVYNLLGQEVALLQDGWMSAGTHNAAFDGAGLPSGVYIYRLECGDAVLTRSMHLVK